MPQTITTPPGATGRVIRIIARRVPWPGLSQRADRSGLRLRWDARTEDGTLLAAATEYPLADGAHILMADQGLPGDMLVTMRREGAGFDSFTPAPLHLVAADGARRAKNRQRLARLGRERAGVPQNSAVDEAAGGHAPAGATGPVSGVFAGGAA